MLTSKETIKLYLTLNKLMYNHALLGKDVYTSNRLYDVDDDIFKKMLEISLIIEYLYDTDSNIIKEGESYPNYSDLEGYKLNQFLDYVTYEYELDVIPYFEFPKSTTNIIEQSSSINTTNNLPNGGGVDFYLTKDISGDLIWKKIDSNNFSNSLKTKSDWDTLNPILKKGEIVTEGVYLNNKLSSSRTKTGDGVSTYKELPYNILDKYEGTQLVTNPIGDIKLNDNLNGKNIINIIEKMVSPYIKPTITNLKVNNSTTLNYKMGQSLPSSLSLTWLVNDKNKIDETYGILESSDINVFSNVGNVDINSQVYNLQTLQSSFSNLKTISINIKGKDLKSNFISSNIVNLKWLNEYISGTNTSGKIETSTDVNNLINKLVTLSTTANRDYNFQSGYPFILIPKNTTNINNIKFIDNDNGLEFSMALQSDFDNTLPSSIIINNSFINIEYNIYRGEHFYNSPASIKVTI